MRPILEHAEFDLVVIGSGVAGAMVAHQVAKDGFRVLILEAGGVPPDSLGRWAMVHNYTNSPSKAPDSPFCGDDVLPVDPKVDPKTDPGKYRFLQPSPIEDGGKNYYDYTAEAIGKKRFFKSYYERIVGGSTWHWQGIYIRMLPNDFRMKTLYKVGFDWPITYRELEPWYVKAEYEMGVAGSDEENEDYYERKWGAYRSEPFPMPALAPSFLDNELARVINDKKVPDHGLRLKVNTVPHAINSRLYAGRPECDGHTSCVPLCPIKARYEAVIHVEKALSAGAVLRTQAVVTKLDVDPEQRWVSRVWYKRPDGTEDRASGRVVVLAANGIENPRILLSSGAANSSDKVGRYLMDHPIKQSFALAPQPLFPFRGPQTTSDIAAFRDGDFRARYAGFKTSIKNDGWASTKTGSPRGNFIPPKDPSGNQNLNGTILDFVENFALFGTDLRKKINDHVTRQITLNSACEQLPRETNRVTLSANSDGLGIAKPMISYNLDDDEYVRSSFKTIIDVHKFIFDQLGAIDRVMQADPPDSTIYGGSGHIMGTTLMGNDPKTSVVDKHCRTHDHPNLFVLGSSVFPTSSTANPTSTVAALALRASETIKEQLKG
ncbi:GMC family oxidoreductase [Bradyrhizobium sp. Leo121]|uniref:GMC family oxidoreductase n=1 Tax=Bradyrhizobium sp. Leo121 TaxID=1571195 RepID=UPI0013EF066B|nr:GMC family oxidoreductase [Bradyrhizobium sp. Leo121]